MPLLIQKRPSPVFDMINSQPVKRKSCTPAVDTSKRQKPLPSTPGRGVSRSKDLRVCTADCRVEFDLSGVQRRCHSAMAAGHPLHGKDAVGTVEKPAETAIGWCELLENSGRGVWLVVRDSTIACFNISGYKFMMVAIARWGQIQWNLQNRTL